MHQTSRNRKRRACLVASGLIFLGVFSLLSFSDLLGLQVEPGSIGLDRISSHFRPSATAADDYQVHGLTKEDFKHQKGDYAYKNINKLNQYESVEVWRSPDSFAPTYPPNKNSRPKVPHWSKYASKGEYLKQPLVADYADGAEKIFLMIKTGADVLWNRLPIHLVTTLTRVPNFALYSDKAGSIGGYEVIDVLANVTDETLQSSEFEKYRKMRFLHNQHNILDASQVKIDGGWDLDKFKNIPMLADAYSKSPNSDWFVFMDADSYIMMDVMTKWLKKLNPNEILYMGSPAMYGDLVFAHGGSVVVLSRKALEETVGKHPEYVEEYEKKAFENCCGDVLVGQMLEEKTGTGISTGSKYPYVHYRFQGNSYWGVYVKEDNWCEQIQTFHHLTAHDVEVLYEYEKMRGPYRDELTHYDIYRDFYLPYIDERIEHWNNLASEVEWTKEKAEDLPEIKEGLKPYESFKSCNTACELTDWCLSFRYIEDKKYCGLSGSIQLGSAVIDWDSDEKDKEHDITSGFMISRIREMRQSQKCDILHGTKPGKKHDDDEEDLDEGWFLRRTKKEEQDRLKGKEPAVVTITIDDDKKKAEQTVEDVPKE